MSYWKCQISLCKQVITLFPLSFLFFLNEGYSFWIFKVVGKFLFCGCAHHLICNDHHKNVFHQTSFSPHPAASLSSSSSSSLKLPPHSIDADGSCGDSSCMAEKGAIKRRRLKEEVKGPVELLPSNVHTGSWEPGASHRGVSMECFAQA